MGILEGKKALIFGVANNRSIAWGIAKAMYREGATIALSYAGPALLKRLTPLAQEIGSDFVEECDVTDDQAIDNLFEKIGSQLGNIDILIHSIAFADRDDLTGPYYSTSRQGFHLAMDVSCYSFTALVRRAVPLFNPGSSCLAMTYYGAQKAVPHYNVMGVAKAALEASVRYLAVDLGPLSHRVNAVSAGPIRTLAAAGVSGFKSMHSEFVDIAPLRRNVTNDDVGNAAVYLSSELASGVTGEVHYVDSGFNIVGVTTPINEK
ncbi:MAG: enoyl-[acyl-carrier-protein] reductase FabI [Chloroflexi bacterium]|nr:enoyl-[acyl-carrier-protein] reductase FabI [Chloroflexota bacterium]|tara:strand:+ start:1260 stop:2048 length:789 start_codon:yes stop_codon:yes gene_type:complete